MKRVSGSGFSTQSWECRKIVKRIIRKRENTRVANAADCVLLFSRFRVISLQRVASALDNEITKQILCKILLLNPSCVCNAKGRKSVIFWGRRCAGKIGTSHCKRETIELNHALYGQITPNMESIEFKIFSTLLAKGGIGRRNEGHNRDRSPQ